MSAHTPGPWTLDYGGGYGKGDVKAGDQIVARCHIPPRYSNGRLSGDAIAEMEANARLIAAAPALLEALEGMLEASVCRDCVTCEQARAAIRAARGEPA